MQPSAELTDWLQDIHIVGANEILGQVDDGGHQTLLCVCVCVCSPLLGNSIFKDPYLLVRVV